MPIRKRGDRYQVRVSLGNGRRIERSLPKGATRADARALETALIRRQIDTAAGRRPDRLIDEAIAEWLPAAQRLKSWNDLRCRIGVLQDTYTDGKHLSDIPEVARAVIKTGQKAGLAPASINRYLAILRRVGNLALRWGWTDEPVGKRIDMLPGERQRDALLTVEQVQAISEAAGGAIGDAILFAALTGLRRGEMMRLTAGMIRNDCIVLDAETKSGKPRIVPLTPEAARIARERIPWEFTVSELRRAFERARAAAGLPHVRFHDCRHAFGSWLAAGGASMTDIRDLMGHSSLVVTSRYLHSEAERLRVTMGRLPDLKRVTDGSADPAEKSATG